MRILIINSIFVTLLLSCNKTKTNSEIETCINNGIIDNFEIANSFEYREKIIRLTPNFNLFDTLKNIEIEVFERYNFSEKNKLNYQAINQKGIKEIVDKSNPFMKSLAETPGPSVHYAYDSCPRQILKEKLSIHSQKLSSVLENIFLEGYPNEKVIAELIENINFNNSTERKILLYCIYMKEHIEKKH